MPKKKERNKQLVILRRANPELYSFRKLASIFNIKESTAHEIWEKYKDEFPNVRELSTNGVDSVRDRE